MKVVQFMVLWLICTWALPLSAAPARVEQVEFSGRNYVRLKDWARANDFDIRWLKVGDTLQLTNRQCRFIFDRDSRESELNGIRVCLSFPIIIKDGAGFISRLDLDTAIGPLLKPPRNWSGAKVRNIVLDPGHGGKDPGNQDGSQQEKKYALLLAQELRAQLTRAGFNVSLTRTDDTFIDLPVRPDIARRRKADLLLSLHWNKIPGKSEIKGAQIFCLTPAGASSSNSGGDYIGAGPKIGNRNDEKNMLLAFQLQQSLLQNLRVEDRGVRRARWWVLRDAQMPAVLVEGGFMSNPREAKLIYDAGYRQQMARAITDGVLSYKRIVENTRQAGN